ncbi:Oxoglutarate and iron-dependent oxygenase degradation C-term-domain-containing protein [Crassisporium funariophilum]|nr:Oxoglutarate and iron-dependent oxygenase degradation C-term-domain-containing protein [Crassisporium funariophilum]
MARTRERSTSIDNTDPASVIKRLKTSHITPGENTDGLAAPAVVSPESLIKPSDPTSQFANELFDHNHIARLNATYVDNCPFKYVVVDKLFQDELLRKVKDECLSELNFTEKETDIYKVNQTGDLASLNYLSSAQISRLSNLQTLRDALYSPEFRNFLRAVTGCGPLSGKKQDMSVNSYTRGCHLLNHDDVIGSRRVSYILYMPLPHYQLWQKDWGGALELYSVTLNDDGQLEPEPMPSKSIPPSWNQFIFFEVQPGRSFHSVEEVVVGGEGEDGRERLSISGWFHAAQEGEEGYVPEAPAPEVKSSREQLTSTSTMFKAYPDTDPEVLPDITLSEDHTAFLAEFLNPVYLQERTMKGLSARFVEESSLELRSFLNHELEKSLEPRLRELDSKDGLGEDRPARIPCHTCGTFGRWTVKGPPHKWRYCVLKPLEEGARKEAVTPRSHASSTDEIMRSLQDELFTSAAFRAWLNIVSRLMPMRYAVEARRFRPGLDYTLATSEETEARLDVVLGLTPPVREPDSEDEENRYTESRGWQAAEWGGWECYMAPHNEEDDPAIYRSSSHKKAKTSAPPPTDSTAAQEPRPKASTSNSDGSNPSSNPSTATDGDSSVSGEEPVDSETEPDAEPMDEDEEEESTLLTVQPGFNSLLLVLRDERVMRFVKYVSAASEGSRWDVCGEYEVGVVQEEEEIEEDES